MIDVGGHHPPTPSSEEEGGIVARHSKAPSSLEEGVGGGGVTREVLLKRAAAMRRNPTEPERRLWMELRDSRFGGFKFRRQAIMNYRIVDFFCPAVGLVVELDGETHELERDQRRDKKLVEATEFAIVRFRNEDVMRNLNGVLLALQQALADRPGRWPEALGHHPPAPSSKEDGE